MVEKYKGIIIQDIETRDKTYTRTVQTTHNTGQDRTVTREDNT